MSDFMIPLVLAFCLQAKDDPAPITAPIESWYALERADGQGWLHSGYVHEQVTPVGGRDWAYEYVWEASYIFPVGVDGLARGRVYVEAQLRENFGLLRLEGAAMSGLTSRKFLVRTEETRRVLVIDVNAEKVKKVELSLDDGSTVLPSLLLYAAFRSKLLGERAELRYLDVWGEETAVAIDARAGAPDRRAVLGKEATVRDVALRGLTAMPDYPVLRNNVIDRFGRIVSATNEEGSFRLLLVAGEKEAVREDTMLQEAVRRDVFDKKKVRTADGTAPVIQEKLEARVHVVPGEEEKELGLMGERIAQLREYVGSQRTDDARRTFELVIATYRRIYGALKPHERDLLEKHRADAETLYGGVGRLLRQGRALVATIEDFATARDLERAGQRLRLLEGLAGRPEFWRRNELGEMEKLVREGEARVELCRATIALEAKKLVLTGAAVTSDPRTTHCIINDTACRVGDVVEGVRVESITRDVVVVSIGAARRELSLAGKR